MCRYNNIVVCDLVYVNPHADGEDAVVCLSYLMMKHGRTSHVAEIMSESSAEFSTRQGADVLMTMKIWGFCHFPMFVQNVTFPSTKSVVGAPFRILFSLQLLQSCEPLKMWIYGTHYKQ